MKNMVLLLCILFLCSWAEADAQGFHLQPTPQKYVGSEDSVFIPARYSLQVGALCGEVRRSSCWPVFFRMLR